MIGDRLCILREPKSGKIWSAGHMPIAANADSYMASFTEDKAEIIRTDGYFTTTLECAVSPEDNAEVRRLTIANTGLAAREIELTSYSGTGVGSGCIRHGTSSFLQDVCRNGVSCANLETLLATRRRRSPGDPEIWIAQFMLFQGIGPWKALEVETDRARFIGVGNSTRMPAAMKNNEHLSNTVGAVLDPVFAMRRRMRIPAGRQARCTIWTVVADSREAVLDLVDRHRQTCSL